MRAHYPVLTSFLALVAGGGGCSSAESSPVSFAPTLLFPTGLLDSVQSVALTVYDASDGVSCDAPSGNAVGVTAQTPMISSTTPAATGCTGGAKFCESLTVPQSAATRIFAALASDTSGRSLAVGCASSVVNQDSLAIAIKMLRFVAPSVCGDNVVNGTEQCDPPGTGTDFVCDSTCHTKEEWLSNGTASAGGTVSGGVGDKTRPAFGWPAQSGATGRFVAAWSDKAPGPKSHVAMRVMTDSLQTTNPGDPPGPAAAAASFFIPNDPGVFPATPDAGNQLWASIASVAGKYYVAYQDDLMSGGSSAGFDIHLRSMDAALKAEQGPGLPIGINGSMGGGEAGQQGQPTLSAGPNGALFVVWQNAAGLAADGSLLPGNIVGRIYTPNDPAWATVAQIEITPGTSTVDQHPRVAGTSTGWVVVWESGADVKMRLLDKTGAPPAPEQVVNSGNAHHGIQDHPDVAAIDAGRFAITWADHGASGGTDIFVQRYSSTGLPIAGDQIAAVNNVVVAGEQLAGGSAAGGVFVVAWLDDASQHVRARLLGGASGFLFNNVDGKDGDFQASVLEGRARANPVATIGGAGQFIAIGWEDLDPSQPGIYVRRFPVPK